MTLQAMMLLLRKSVKLYKLESNWFCNTRISLSTTLQTMVSSSSRLIFCCLITDFSITFLFAPPHYPIYNVTLSIQIVYTNCTVQTVLHQVIRTVSTFQCFHNLMNTQTIKRIMSGRLITNRNTTAYNLSRSATFHY